MGDWLENNIDWAVLPQPLLGHAACRSGSARTARSSDASARRPSLGLKDDADLHRPYIDAVTVAVRQVRRRDAPRARGDRHWFDSGSMPFAQRGYPRQDKELFEETFPADFISEAIDQTRGWFYTLLADLDAALQAELVPQRDLPRPRRRPEGQESVEVARQRARPELALRHVRLGRGPLVLLHLDAGRRELPDGRRSARRRSSAVLHPALELLLVLRHLRAARRLRPGRGADPAAEQRHVLDRWLLSQAERPGRQTSTAGWTPTTPSSRRGAIQRFVDDLSNWYVRRSRRRFWKSESDTDKLSAYQTLYEALRTVRAADGALRALRRRTASTATCRTAERPPRRLPEPCDCAPRRRSRQRCRGARQRRRGGSRRPRRGAPQGPAAAAPASRCRATRCPTISRPSSARS